MYIFASCFISQIHLCRIFEETDIYQKDKQYDKT